MAERLAGRLANQGIRVVVGNWADTGSTGIYATLKMVRASDAMVMSASNFVIPRKLVSNVISR